MKYPAYPKYKDSGVEWLGEVPEHWEVKKIKYIARLESGHTPDKQKEEYWTDCDIPWVSLNDSKQLASSDYIDETAYQINRKGLENSSARILPARAVVFTRDATIGLAAITCRDMAVSQHIIAWICRLDFVIPEFLLITIYAMQTYLDSFTFGSTIKTIGLPDIKKLRVPVPAIAEQERIVQIVFNNRTKLDTLIAKKRELIDKLKEKRAALITCAVTRGLPPDAAKAAGLDPQPKMKDSGVEWLGEVPAHWEVKRFSRHINKIEQGWSPPAEAGLVEDGCWGVLKLSAVKAGKFNPEECKGLPDDIVVPKELEVLQGDLLITRANTPELVGDVCVVGSTPPLRMLCDLIYRVRVDEKKLDKVFISFYLLSKPGRSQVFMDARGTSGSMVKISQSHIKGWLVPVPPLPEQHAIAAYLDRETAAIDALVAKVETAIDRLQEYRAALITAAVTGMINVLGG